MGFSDAKSLAIESWTLYAIAILTVAARLSVTLSFFVLANVRQELLTLLPRASRTILLGAAKKWEIDDYLMMVVVVCSSYSRSTFLLANPGSSLW